MIFGELILLFVSATSATAVIPEQINDDSVSPQQKNSRLGLDYVLHLSPKQQEQYTLLEQPLLGKHPPHTHDSSASTVNDDDVEVDDSSHPPLNQSVGKRHRFSMDDGGASRSSRPKRTKWKRKAIGLDMNHKLSCSATKEWAVERFEDIEISEDGSETCNLAWANTPVNAAAFGKRCALFDGFKMAFLEKYTVEQWNEFLVYTL